MSFLHSKHKLFLIVSVALISGAIFPFSALAIVYQPGETLNPACAPTDVNCGVAAPITASSTSALSLGGVAPEGSLFYVAGTSTLQNIIPAGNLLYSIGSPESRLQNVYTNNLILGSASFVMEDVGGVLRFRDVNSVIPGLIINPSSGATINGNIFINGGAIFANATTTGSHSIGGALVLGGESFQNLVGVGLKVVSSTLALDNSGDWVGTFDGQEASYFLANSFSTSSANLWLDSKTTGNLTEGSNLYWTTIRGNQNFAANLAATTTDALAEGAANKYYTDARFDNRFILKTTNDLAEGGNLYYTDARFDNRFVLKTTSGLTEGVNLYYTDARARNALSATAPISYASSTGVFGISQAGSFASGYLSSGDWNTFNNKLNTSLSNGLLWIGDTSNTATAVAFSGDATIDNLGALTIANLAVTNGKLAADSVNSSKITDSSVSLADLNTDSVNAVKVVDGSLTTSDLSAAAGITNGQLANSSFTMTLGTSGTDANVSGASVSLGGSLTLNFPTASSSARGLLSSADWSTFNNKEPAIVASTSVTYFRGDKTFQTLDTSAVPENGNVYYTSARFTSDFATKSTSNLTEGLNLYWTTIRGNQNFAANLAATTTDALAEGVANKYYTDARFDNRFVLKTTSGLTEGVNLYYTDARARNALSATAPISYASSTGVFSLTTGNITAPSNPEITIGGGTGAVVGSGVTITVPEADAITRGLVSTTTQVFAGSKIFSFAPTFSTINSGSVLFAGTGGLLLNDSANLYWDDINKRLGVGDGTPLATLTVGSGDLFQVNDSGNIVAIGGAAHSVGNAVGALNIDSFGVGAINFGTGANGKTITLGNTTGATGLVFNSGSGNINFDSGTLYVDTINNRVGIGTSAPGAKLVLNGGVFSHTPDAPQFLAGLELATAINKIVVAGKYLYSAHNNGAGGNEFNIIDISNPSASSVRGGLNYTPEVRALAVSGKYAYIGLSANTGGTEFRIVDISNPSSPVELGGTEHGDNVYTIAISGRYAFVGHNAGTDEFDVVDISNPLNPQIVAGIDLGGTGMHAYSIKIQGRYAYVGGGNATANFWVIDISNPLTPAVVSSVDLQDSVLNVDVKGRYAYAGFASNATRDFAVVDISNPAVPSLVGSLEIDNNNTNEVVAAGKYVYVVRDSTVGSGELFVVDVSNPSTPIIVASAEIGLTVNAFAVSGKYAFVGKVTNSGTELDVYSISGMESPAANIGTLAVDDISSAGDALVAANLTVGSGLRVGERGIATDGSLSINGTSTSFFGGNVGIGTVIPGAKLMVDGSAAGDIQLLVQGAPSQTVDLMVVENSAGADIFSIGASGKVLLKPSSNSSPALIDGGNVNGLGLLDLKSFDNSTPAGKGVLTVRSGLASITGAATLFQIGGVTAGTGGIETALGISNITAGAGTETALSIGSGWDTDIAFIDTTPTISLGNTGTLSITDGANTLFVLQDVGTTGNVGIGTLSPSAALHVVGSEIVNSQASAVGAGATQRGLQIISGSLGANDGAIRGIDVSATVAGTTNIGDELTGLRVEAGAIDANGTTRGLHIVQPSTVGAFSSVVQDLLTLERSGGTLTNALQYVDAGATKFAITAAGNVGIGTSTPDANLRVWGTARIGAITGANPAYELYVVNNGTGPVARFQDADGFCDINPTSASLGCVSDISLKKNILTLDNSLEKVLKLNPVTFNWRSEEDDMATHVGFIAQEVEEFFPALVSTDESGLKLLSYTNFAPILTKAIQEIAALGETFKQKLTMWFADAANGIGDFFAEKIHTEQICLKKSDGNEYCVNGDDLEAIINQKLLVSDTNNDAKEDVVLPESQSQESITEFFPIETKTVSATITEEVTEVTIESIPLENQELPIE